MIRFDYLHDPPSRVWGTIRAARFPRRFYGVGIALAAAALFAGSAAAIERERVAQAERTHADAQRRFERSRETLQRFKLQWREIDAMLAEDRRLREIRLSGARVAARLAAIGNVFPSGVTVDSVRADAGGFSVKGEASTISAVGGVLRRIVASDALPHPGVVRLARDSGALAGFAFEFDAGAAR